MTALQSEASVESSLSRLFDHHRRQLNIQSAIRGDVIVERGYYTLMRGSATEAKAGLETLKRLGIPGMGRDSDARLPGLVIPLYRPTGAPAGVLYKPDHPPKDDKGKPRKYLQPTNTPPVVDCHPRNSRYMPDPTVPLFITEGTKKADCLTSHGLAAVSISGVYNWRDKHGTLGDWESIMLKGRKVTICFDADARTNSDVLKAMQRLGKWLKSRGAKPYYLIVPAEVDGQKVKGVDDYFAAGGDVDGLRKATTSTPPQAKRDHDVKFTDAGIAEILVEEALGGSFVWCAGLGWHHWTGKQWEQCSDAAPMERARLFVLARFAETAEKARDMAERGRDSKQLGADMEGWYSMLKRARLTAAVALSAGILEVKADAFDAHPDLLNTPDGVVDLRTGQVTAHDPGLLLTRITRGSYRPGSTHLDWHKALAAMPEDTRDWMQVRLGQGATGHPTPDGRLLVLQGGGQNGKSLLTTDGVLPALGDYAAPASHKLFMSTKGSEHSTEMADLRGQRLLIAEELTEGRSIDVTALKRIQDVGQIKARYVHKDNITFSASHSLMCTTNTVPVINETDHGTWRRLVLVRFPYRFLPPGVPLMGPNDREGDPALKSRIRAGRDGQHDAIVTWIVEGAMRWYADLDGKVGVMEPPPTVAADTLDWRIEADRILGYWKERLAPEVGERIWTVDLLHDFNRWLEANGHSPWSKELFAARFLSHEETTRHRVTQQRTRSQHGLSRPALIPAQAMPAQPVVFTGIRFRSPTEEGVQTVQTLQETSSRTRGSQEFPKGSAQSAHLCTGDETSPF